MELPGERATEFPAKRAAEHAALLTDGARALYTDGDLRATRQNFERAKVVHALGLPVVELRSRGAAG
jgi:hypothetical protein